MTRTRKVTYTTSFDEIKELEITEELIDGKWVEISHSEVNGPYKDEPSSYEPHSSLESEYKSKKTFTRDLKSEIAFEEYFNVTYKYRTPDHLFLRDSDLFNRTLIRKMRIEDKLKELGTCNRPNTIGVGYRRELGSYSHFYSYVTNENGYTNGNIFPFSSFKQALKDARKRYTEKYSNIYGNNKLVRVLRKKTKTK